MNQENPLFQGFQPQVIAGGDPIDQPFTEPVGKKKRKSGGKKKKAAAPSASLPQIAGAPMPAPAAPAPKTRKPRTPKATKRAPKFELQAILAATAGLKEADMPGFEKGLNVLMDTNAVGRARLLAAWAKVFA